MRLIKSTAKINIWKTNHECGSESGKTFRTNNKPYQRTFCPANRGFSRFRTRSVFASLRNKKVTSAVRRLVGGRKQSVCVSVVFKGEEREREGRVKWRVVRVIKRNIWFMSYRSSTVWSTPNRGREKGASTGSRRGGRREPANDGDCVHVFMCVSWAVFVCWCVCVCKCVFVK